jgi:hypothetical protein
MTTISAASGDIIYLSQPVSGSTISYRINSGPTIPIGSWPVNLENSDISPTDYIKVYFETDIILSGGTDRYLICGSQYIQIGNDLLNTDGTQTKITIDGITDYPGLVQNGLSNTDGKDNIIVKNIGLEVTNGSTLAQYGGWIGQRYFSRGTISHIINCYSTGGITSFSGGITGAESFIGINVNSSINNCYSKGNIFGTSAGGIIGQASATLDCKLEISYCYSIGNISGNNSGGIAGGLSGGVSGVLTIIKCYSSGTISGSNAGGICGYYVGETSGNTVADSCYSLGAISGTNAGGIYGTNAGNDGSATAINCYSAGLLSGAGDRGIFGGSPGTVTRTNCYVANGSWTDEAANLDLTGIPIISDAGTTWARTDGLNTPYKLVNMGYSPYSRSLVTTIADNIIAPDQFGPAIVSGHTFQILAINDSDPATYPDITLNTSTGLIQFSATIPSGSYIIVIYDYINPYAITTLELEIQNNEQGGDESYCCPNTINANFPLYEIKESVKEYKAMNYDAFNYGKKVFNSYSDYIKYKMTRNYICQ